MRSQKYVVMYTAAMEGPVTSTLKQFRFVFIKQLAAQAINTAFEKKTRPINCSIAWNFSSSH
ncbi:hypothetical protein AXI58_00120 [Bacillus nakamurai]|uniref:Uncharacterized protein n=1 Tax=Bacillus nakamurai TaxID=1793963 RepID=A0A150FCK2_9BACI|nr:hypothetical protein AXI58_00120 [Bacillus nakamurai]